MCEYVIGVGGGGVEGVIAGGSLQCSAKKAEYPGVGWNK